MSQNERNARSMTAQEIAAAIRADLEAAVKAGTLPKAAYFVRQTWSGHTPSIRVNVKGWAGTVLSPEFVDFVARHNEYPRHLERYTAEANALLAAAEKIASVYNFNESRSEEDYFHVGYYLDVEFDRDAVAIDATIAARRTAIAAEAA